MQIIQSQSRHLSLTTQTIQSIEVLQYTHQELHEFLCDQAERNPLIDLQTPTISGLGGGGNAPAGGSGASPLGRIPVRSQSFADISETQASTTTLRDHLCDQAGMSFRCPTERQIAMTLAESLDPDGYLRRALWEIAELLGCDEALIENVLLKVQTFDPIGVGARNLAECLRLQLREHGALTVQMSCLLDNLSLLATHEIDKLARRIGIPRAEVLVLAKSLRKLNPMPGLQYDQSPIQPALPDILVTRLGDGSFAVNLNPELVPRVLVNQTYYAEISAGVGQKETKRYLKSCLSNAHWVARQLDQRAQTVIKVAAEIVAKQRGFLDHGIEHLRPLDLRDVAEAVGVHESTVSRAISNKYMMTPRGVFELKFFFPEGLGQNGGDTQSVATDAIRYRMKKLIANESPNDILSDDQIVVLMRNEGIDIARRTVAKYRSLLKVPSSAIRRRQKQLI